MIRPRTLAGRPVNPVGLGCMSLSWAYGTPPGEDAAAALLRRALDLGYDHFDTACIYGDGHNESLIGRTLAGQRQGFFLATKAGIVVDGSKRRIDCSPAALRASCERSLERLRTDHIDLFYLHRRDFDTPIEESVGALAALVKEGKIGAIGLSEMSAATLRRACSEHPIAAMQTEYSPWTRNADIAVIDACAELGVAFVAFSPLARGVLANAVRDPATLPAGDIRKAMPRFAAPNWASNLALVDGFNALAAECSVTPAQLSLAFVLSRGEHVLAIPGTSNIDHLTENMARADWTIPPGIAARVDALINTSTVAGNRYGAAMQATIDTEEFD